MVMCISSPNSLLGELTIGASYSILNITEKEILIVNNLKQVKWYELKYFKFI